MKILIEFLWGIEAGPLFSYGLASGLKANGHDVYCILLEQTENRAQWIETFGSSHLSFVRSTPKKKKPLSSGVTFLTDCLKIKSKFHNIIFDLTIRTFVHPYDPVIFKFIRTNKLATVCHDPIPHSGNNDQIAEKYHDQIRHSGEIIVLTKAFIPVLEERYGIERSHIHYLRHGLMVYQRSSSPMKKNDPAESINYLFFGRIEAYKGLHVLADAYRLLTQNYSNVSITIAGGGDFSDYTDEYQELPNVTIINRYINEEEIESLFDTGNTVVVLPYIDATQSGVIPIAFDFGVPVIASNTGGLAEQLFGGEYGILFETGNSQALADSMAAFVNSPKTYQYQAKKMKEGRDLLKWENVAKELIDSW